MKISIVSRLLMMILVFSMASPSYAQSCKKRYKDKIEEGSKIVSCSYTSTIEKTTKGSFIFKRYYPDSKQITAFLTADSKDFDNLHGLFYECWDDGTVVNKGMYVNNYKQGAWQENEDEFGSYKNGLREGLWLRKNNKDEVSERSHYISGVLHGKRLKYDSVGTVILTEEYSSGELVSTTADTTKVYSEELPRFPGCEGQGLDPKELKDCSTSEMLRFVYSTLRYPSFAREKGIQGTARIEYVIKKDGSIGEVRVLNGLCKQIEQAIMDVIDKMPKWRPGYQDGEPVDVLFLLPVKFRLE